ncbi:MAG: hypothetical protein ACREQO_07410 [Candidatus Binatia bacterium]
MRLVVHPKVYSDIDKIMGYYKQVATRQLADEFYAELRYHMQQAAERPESFGIRERDLRRVLLAMSCECSSCATIEDVPPLALDADNVAQPRTGATDKTFPSTFSEFRKLGRVSE